ncbi:unnamed protein product, partial [Hymenolepis diminuta]
SYDSNQDSSFNVKECDTVTCLSNDINVHLQISLSKDSRTASMRDYYFALSNTLWERLSLRWLRSKQMFRNKDPKRVFFLSMEYLMGRTLGNAIMNLGFSQPIHECLSKMGLNMEEIEDCEPDVSLGNGGLGRLAACFMDSMANLGIAATGYGIRYNYGVFQQKIVNSWQYEEPDDWLCFGNPWERVRQGISYPVKYRGKVEIQGGRRIWTDTEMVYAVPYDMPIPGYRCNICCTLRLWGCKAP